MRNNGVCHRAVGIYPLSIVMDSSLHKCICSLLPFLRFVLFLSFHDHHEIRKFLLLSHFLYQCVNYTLLSTITEEITP